MNIKRIYFTLNGQRYRFDICNGLNKAFILKNLDDPSEYYMDDIVVETVTFKERFKTFKFNCSLIRDRLTDWFKGLRKTGYEQKLNEVVDHTIYKLVPQKKNDEPEKIRKMPFHQI